MLNHTSTHWFLDKSVASDPSETDGDASQTPESMREAFGELYVRHFETVRSFIAQRNGCLDSSEDLAHEAFLRAWRQTDQRKKATDEKNYLLGIAKNVLSEGHREQKKLSVRSLEEVPPDEHPSYVAAEADESESVEYRQIIAQAMGKLTALQRQAIKLAARGDLSRAEAAAAAGCTRKQFEGRLYRGRNRLRELLKDAQVTK